MSTRKPMWILIAGFSTVLVANGALVYYALISWTGLETQQPYVKGLAYNTNLEGAKRQQELGWQATFTTDYISGDLPSGVLNVRFTDKNDQPLNDLQVRIKATRPTNEGFDRDFTLTPQGDGRFQGTFDLPLKGQWDLRILAWRGDDNYQRVERIVTP